MIKIDHHWGHLTDSECFWSSVSFIYKQGEKSLLKKDLNKWFKILCSFKYWIYLHVEDSKGNYNNAKNMWVMAVALK